MTFTTYELIERFIKNFPHIKADMSASDHNYSSTELNPYHIEGDVWTHTMMVLNVARLNNYPIEVQLACLLHDVGKAYTREETIKTNKETGAEYNYVSYNGHDGVSFYNAVEILQTAYADMLTEDQMFTIAKLVALHSNLYSWQNSGDDVSIERIKQAYAGDMVFLGTLAKLAHCDADGRVHMGKTRSVADADPRGGKRFLDFEKITPYASTREGEKLKRPMLTLLVGPPCAGKSTWKAENIQSCTTVISRDAYVEQLGEGDTYSEKFKSLSKEDQAKIDQLVLKDFNAALKIGEGIVVDMTNMSKSSRKKFVSPAKRSGYVIEAVVFHVGVKTMKARNLSRTIKEGKFIPTHVFDNMMKSFSYPLFDEVDFVEDVISKND